MLHPKTLIRGATLLAALALAPAAGAATITYDGNTLVYTGDGPEVNDVIASEGVTDGYIRFYEYQGADISGPGDRCQLTSSVFECQIPSAMRVELGAGNDEFSLFSDFPDSVAVTMHGDE